MKVTVCISVYNGAQYLDMQLLSIANQTDLPDEVIVYDDCSSDDSLSVIKKYVDVLSVKIFRGTTQLGVLGGFLYAIEQASGDIIMFCDQDDVWEKNKISIHKGYHKGKYDVVISDCLLVDGNMKLMQSSYQKYFQYGKGFWGNIVESKFLGCCMSLSRNAICFIGPPPKIYAGYHDLWYGILSLLFFNVIFIDEKLVFYRRHENTVTPSGGKSFYSITEKISRRFNLLLSIIVILPTLLKNRMSKI